MILPLIKKVTTMHMITYLVTEVTIKDKIFYLYKDYHYKYFHKKDHSSYQYRSGASKSWPRRPATRTWAT